MYFPVILKTGETKLVNLTNLKGITLGEVGPSLVESKPIRKVSFHSVRLDEADFSVDEESFQEGEFDKFCSALFANSLPKKFMDKKNKSEEVAMNTLHSLKELGTLLPPKKTAPKKTTAPIGNQLAAIAKIMSKGKTFPDYNFNFGKWEGYSLEYVYKNDKQYLYWVISEENVVGPRIRKMIMEVLGVKE